MPIVCSAVGCLSQQGALTEFSHKISFHEFPQEECLKQKWLRNMKRVGWTPSKCAKLCSLHFKPSCYREGSEKRLLHPFAEPTIFKNQTALKEGEDIIASVYQYLQFEYEYLNSFIGSSCDLSSLANILARTAKATGASEETVTAVLKKRRKRLSYSEDEGPQEQQSKLDHYCDEKDVSPIEVDSSSKSADKDHREDDEGQIQQEEHETGTLKLEFEVEPEEHCEAVRGRPQPPTHESSNVVPHEVPTYAEVKIEPVDEEHQPLSRKMTFKIVETIERGRRLIETVPSSWERDGNLYWPRKKIMSLKKNEECTPQLDWNCLPCILLRDNILDYKAAELEIARMSDATDTRDKENVNLRKKTSVETNFDNPVMECIQEHTSNTFGIADPQTPESTKVLQQIGHLIEMVSTIQENQKVLFENQNNTLKALAVINTKIQEFVTRSQGLVQDKQREESSSFKTLNNIEELTAFEDQLKNPLIEAQYIQELSIICSEKKTGLNNAYALVDVMFDRKLMTRFSWAGGTKGEPKHCFKAFQGTITLFLNLVHQCDKTFTKPVCDEFFKNILRHSVKRNLSKRVRDSTTKKKAKKCEATQ